MNSSVANEGVAGATRHRCVACQSPDAEVFWFAQDVPVFCNVLCDTRDAAQQMPRGDIRLAFCPSCQLIYNVAFDPGRLDYGVEYENSLHFSPRFQKYADELAARLVERYALRGKTVVEIACGKGDFLRSLCRLGGARGVGYDPAWAPEADAGGDERVSFVQEYYSPEHTTPADLIVCRHALEHIPDPVGFLKSVRASIGERRDTAVFFEVPNGMYTIREMGIWDLIYEHCLYFVAGSLARVFELAGFDVQSVTEEFDGQFLTIEARPAANAEVKRSADQPAVADDVRAFAKNYADKLAHWRGWLDEMRADDRRAVVWGSGSKGVTFLNILRPGERIEHVVDINPRKQGRFVAGAGQQIVAPESLREYGPDSVVVMNPVYLDEIRATVEALGLSPEFLIG